LPGGFRRDCRARDRARRPLVGADAKRGREAQVLRLRER
jgi:hypothetical protein